jgi:hypothetical protein
VNVRLRRREHSEDVDPLKPVRRITVELAQRFTAFGDTLDEFAASIDDTMTRLWELHDDATGTSGEEDVDDPDGPEQS